MIDKIDVRSVPEGEVCSLKVQLSQRRSKGSRDVAFLNRKPIQLSLLLSGKNGGVHLAYRSRYNLQSPSLHNIQKLFRGLSHVGQTDFFDRLENFLYQFTRCLCYNLFHGDAPHFRSFFALANKFYHERRVPAIFYFPLRPPGGGDPACRRPGGRYFSQNYFTLTGKGAAVGSPPGRIVMRMQADWQRRFGPLSAALF